MSKIFDKRRKMYWNQTILLHDHLDGSYPLVIVLPKLFRMSGKEYPFKSEVNVHADMARLFKDPHINIVDKFKNTTGVMQNFDTLSLAAETYVGVRSWQGMRYCEFTIAPQYHTFGGLSEKQVIEALIDGIKKGEAQFRNIEVNIIFSVGREVSSEEAVRLVNVAGECDQNYVVGIGLVCDEAAHPPQKHIAMFKRAKKLGFKTTCHAGEWIHFPDEKPDFQRDMGWLLRNIRVAVYDLEVDRLDHAIPIAYDRYLTQIVKERNIGIGGCPGSNLTTGLISNVSVLRIRDLLEKNIFYFLGPDDDLFMPNVKEVFTLCNKEYHFTEEEKKKLLRNPWLCRFGKRKEHCY